MYLFLIGGQAVGSLPSWHPFYLDLGVRCSCQPQAFHNRVLLSNPPALLIQFTFLGAVFLSSWKIQFAAWMFGLPKVSVHLGSPFPIGLAWPGMLHHLFRDCCPPVHWRGLSSSCQACPLLGAKKRPLCAATGVGEQGGVEGMTPELSPSVLT